MPPKRKRADETTTTSVTTSSRATRSTNRATKTADTNINVAKNGQGKKNGSAQSLRTPISDISSNDATEDGDEENGASIIPAPKKVKTSKKATRVVNSSLKKMTRGDEIQSKALSEQKTLANPAEGTPPLKSTRSQLKCEPYLPEHSLALFKKYCETDEDVIGPEGFERLCTEANLPLDGSQTLILAWQMNSKELAKISKDEWVTGMDSLKIHSLPQLALAMSDLENLLIRNQPAPERQTEKEKEPYDMTAYWSYVENPKVAFRKLYTFCFTLAKPEQSRNIDMETSAAFWSVLLVPQYPIMAEVLDFITERGTYRATNKDLWSMMLEFCETVNPNLEDYETDGAWPTLLDDFVSWKRKKVNMVKVTDPNNDGEI